MLSSLQICILFTKALFLLRGITRKQVVPLTSKDSTAAADRNTLRQRQPHLTRKTLAFAKTDDSHFARTLNFINYYNKSKSP
jgi:hypothetical protein